MKVSNLINKNGRAVPNQFIIEDETQSLRELQSYASLVVSVFYAKAEHMVVMHRDWNYSNTTMRAVNKFLEDNLGGEWNSKNIRKALEAGTWSDEYGKTWSFTEQQ